MFCPKCGAENQDANQECENCNFVFAPEEATEPAPTVSKEIVTEFSESFLKSVEEPRKGLSRQKKVAIVLWIVSAVVLVLSFVASGCIFYGSDSIAHIRTFTGNTLEEAYYRELYTIYNGYALIVIAIGIFMATLLSFFGFRSYDTKEK